MINKRIQDHDFYGLLLSGTNIYVTIANALFEYLLRRQEWDSTVASKFWRTNSDVKKGWRPTLTHRRCFWGQHAQSCYRLTFNMCSRCVNLAITHCIAVELCWLIVTIVNIYWVQNIVCSSKIFDRCFLMFL